MQQAKADDYNPWIEEPSDEVAAATAAAHTAQSTAVVDPLPSPESTLQPGDSKVDDEDAPRRNWQESQSYLEWKARMVADRGEGGPAASSSRHSSVPAPPSVPPPPHIVVAAKTRPAPQAPPLRDDTGMGTSSEDKGHGKGKGFGKKGKGKKGKGKVPPDRPAHSSRITWLVDLTDSVCIARACERDCSSSENTKLHRYRRLSDHTCSVSDPSDSRSFLAGEAQR